MGRIPLAESQIGKIKKSLYGGNYYRFIPDYLWSYEFYDNHRTATFAEFKKLYPVETHSLTCRKKQ